MVALNCATTDPTKVRTVFALDPCQHREGTVPSKRTVGRMGGTTRIRRNGMAVRNVLRNLATTKRRDCIPSNGGDNGSWVVLLVVVGLLPVLQNLFLLFCRFDRVAHKRSSKTCTSQCLPMLVVGVLVIVGLVGRPGRYGWSIRCRLFQNTFVPSSRFLLQAMGWMPPVLRILRIHK